MITLDTSATEYHFIIWFHQSVIIYLIYINDQRHISKRLEIMRQTNYWFLFESISRSISY